jgi:hypothetical protein
VHDAAVPACPGLPAACRARKEGCCQRPPFLRAPDLPSLTAALGSQMSQSGHGRMRPVPHTQGYRRIAHIAPGFTPRGLPSWPFTDKLSGKCGSIFFSLCSKVTDTCLAFLHHPFLITDNHEPHRPAISGEGLMHGGARRPAQSLEDPVDPIPWPTQYFVCPRRVTLALIPIASCSFRLYVHCPSSPSWVADSRVQQVPILPRQTLVSLGLAGTPDDPSRLRLLAHRNRRK